MVGAGAVGIGDGVNEVYLRWFGELRVAPAFARSRTAESYAGRALADLRPTIGRRAARILSLVNAGRDPWRLYPRTAEVLAEVEALPAADRRRVLAFGGPTS